MKMFTILLKHEYNNCNSVNKVRLLFAGRNDELDTLERLYARDSFQLVVMYGRRRVGKTTLIGDKPY